jgi:putative SOS response-associated peptidase YedK
MAPERMVRCLIVLESFAYPEGPADLRTRVWAGLWDEPLCAWAGLCMPDWSGCAGILVPANALLERVSAHMPLLLPPEARCPWLEGCSIHALGGTYPRADWYLERSDEHWSKGTPVDDTQS